MAKKSKSSQDHYHEFLRYWAGEGLFNIGEHVYVFDAEVNYFFRGQSRYIRLRCYAYWEGKVHLFPEKDDWLDADKHHIEFNAFYQKFTLTDSNLIKIEGDSQKIGKYWLDINPKTP